MYQTLYRKYRPKKFDDVFGQNVIVQTLKNAIVNRRISHANMFIGPRGTGKTSIAKLFAKAINCENPIEGDMCGKCASCIVSSNPECLDIIEIDAASNNGVDEIRELRDKVSLVPSSLKYKVYIIDEVHMLTTQAFNALLKTLEEPPEHVVFILATTDPQKVPETIISRCQCYNFNRISEECIFNNLNRICELESVICADDVLHEIAVVSDGGMRDAIGLLDKLISYAQNNITIEQYYEINNIVSQKERLKLINDILSSNIGNVIDSLENWSSRGINIVQTMIKILNDLKNNIIDYYVNSKKNIDIRDYENFSIFINENLEKMKHSSNQKIFIEISILKYMNDNNIVKDDELKSSQKNISWEIKVPLKNISQDKIISQNENISREIIADGKLNDNNVSKKNSSSKTESLNKISNFDDINNVRINNTLATASKNNLISDKEKFEKLNDYVFNQDFGYLVCILLDGHIVASGDEYIILSYEYDSMISDNCDKINLLCDTLKLVDINKKIAIVTDDMWKKIKGEYIEKIKSGVVYNVLVEPEIIYKKDEVTNVDKNDIISNVSTVFGDIVEFDN